MPTHGTLTRRVRAARRAPGRHGAAIDAMGGSLAVHMTVAVTAVRTGRA
ncbi:hypothetical protein AB0I28_00480 [Phytomonospora sp. NPDC050363]